MISSEKLTIIAGPCALESREMSLLVANYAKDICHDLKIDYIFKGSFDKANRTSAKSFRGNGMEAGLSILNEIRESLDIPVLTDVHETYQVETVASKVNVIQIPAYLCRQTSLIEAAIKAVASRDLLASSVNIKKGQFIAPWDCQMIIDKAKTFYPKANKDSIWITERGSSFGYNNLVVDMKGFFYLKQLGCPVIMDATHAVQEPGANGATSGGKRHLVPLLARASVAAGVDAVFLEIHPDPDNALSDGPNMVNLEEFKRLVAELKKIYDLVKNF